MHNERITPLADLADDASAPYFATILVRRTRAAAALTPSELPNGVALVALDAGGLALARRLQPRLPSSRVHGLAGRADGADELFSHVSAHLHALFLAGTPIVGICAAGILVRALAPLLANKHREPPVLAVAQDGSTAVPLLGGHHGANRLARAIAATLGGTAAVTTAGDTRLGFGLDEPPQGWRVANPEAAKSVTAAMLGGVPVTLRIEAGEADWLSAAGIQFAPEAQHAIIVTDRLPRQDDETQAASPLVLHPPVLAIGVGCERGAEPGELIALVRETLAANGLAEGAVACVASIAVKADEQAVHAVADVLGVPARFFSVADLEAEAPRLANPSDVVFREVGCHGVCEGAALAAVGARGSLVVAKVRGARTTCAIGRAIRAIEPRAIGRARGRLSVVGIGPGSSAWRSAEVAEILRDASDVVGYGLYLDLIADLIAGKAQHTTALAQEEERVRVALDLAAEGRHVALVCSGDAGIYALAALVFELLDRENRDEWNRLAIAVAPGISALQAAAARAGAVIGHDFCAVSLSDLLTPWEQIERRLQAAAAGDFVVALYNPVSQRRRTQLPQAKEIFLRHRPGTTPVVLARNLGRDAETIRVVPLADLNADLVDMLTLVLVGASTTRVIERGQHRFVYTPRGYAAKHAGRTADGIPTFSDQGKEQAAE
ncbi:MAG: precorrin-3B C(17)-methyltransferase [Rhodospirillales bacterium]|nr:precorrin-3B C(17)-methyltransferase [Rhodospirillales bacterium]